MRPRSSDKLKPAWQLQAEAAARAMNLQKRRLSPRIWLAEVQDSNHQGSRVGALDSETMVVGTLPLKSAEEHKAGHSFDEPGCLCQHNWVCPLCFVWIRAETRYDMEECTWCGNPRPEVYHPDSWHGGSEFGMDYECPVKVAMEKQRAELAPAEEEGGGGEGKPATAGSKPTTAGSALRTATPGSALSGGTKPPTPPVPKLPPIKLGARPRDSYSRYPMHPPIATMRQAGDARRVDEEWQAEELGIGRQGAVQDIGRDAFEDQPTDVGERAGARPEDEAPPSAVWDWNPVGRFVAGEGRSKEMAEALLARRPWSGLKMRQRELAAKRIGIRKGDFF